MKQQVIIDTHDLMDMQKLDRITLVNHLCGPRSANLIATINSQGLENLAIFNSVMHIGANPPLMGFIMRPLNVERHTYRNIKETGFFSVNQVSESMFKRAHQTSAKYSDEQSEFEHCDFESQYFPELNVPFVAESKIKIALKYKEEHEIKANKTILIVGQVEKIIIEDAITNSIEKFNFEELNSIAVGGLNSYYRCQKIESLAFARP